MKSSKELLISCVLSILFGCSGDSSDVSDLNTTTRDVEINLTEHAIATATYDSSRANLVIDGSTSVDYWSGNIAGDSLTVDLGAVYGVTEITVYLNDTASDNIDTTAFNPRYSNKFFEVSSDGVNWKTTLYPSGSDVPCSYGFSLGGGIISCDVRSLSFTGDIVDNSEPVRYFRTTLNQSDADTIQVYEIEILGWIQETTID